MYQTYISVHVHLASFVVLGRGAVSISLWLVQVPRQPFGGESVLKKAYCILFHEHVGCFACQYNINFQ